MQRWTSGPCVWSVLSALRATTVKGRSSAKSSVKKHRRPLEDSGPVQEALAGAGREQEGLGMSRSVLGRPGICPEPIKVETSSPNARHLSSVRSLMPVWESCRACVVEWQGMPPGAMLAKPGSKVCISSAGKDLTKDRGLTRGPRGQRAQAAQLAA